MYHFVMGKMHKFVIGLIVVLTVLSPGGLPNPAMAANDPGTAEIIKEAQKEGKVVMYTTFTLTDAMAFVEKFQKKYPFLKVDLHRLNNTQILTRVFAEQRAKKPAVDVITCKGDTIYFMQKSGLLGKYLSPERKFYADGFKDKEGYWTDVYPTVHCVVYNTRMVAPQDVPVTYQDLLKPRWKGKIGVNPNNYMWQAVILQTLGKEAGLKYLEALSRQNPIVRDGGTLNIMLTAAGEMAMAVSVNANLVEKEKAKQAPVDWARIKPYYGDLHPIALTAHPLHPNAGKLLIDYFLSQEGQELMVDLGNVPARKGLKSKIVRSEEVIPIDPALGEQMEYYQKLMKQTFVKKL